MRLGMGRRRRRRRRRRPPRTTNVSKGTQIETKTPSLFSLFSIFCLNFLKMELN